ncbi:MAG: winged helix-turn-helix domain-containing protein [Lentisphaeria bacterium]
MKSVSVIKENQSEQVANELERQIGTGLLVPGRKLPSFRELAAQFSVSRQVIESAFALLEERHLIIRRPRVGIYVNPDAFSPSKREFCLLRLLNDARNSDYVGQILSVSDMVIWRGCNLSIRSISDRNYSRGILLYELEKLRQAHVDCLLVYNPSLREEDIPEFEKLPFPVVFLGDSIPDACMGRVANQIVEETADRAKAMVAAAAHYGYRNAVLVGEPLAQYYCQVMKAAGAAAAREAGLGFRYVERAREECDTMAELALLRRQCVAEILAGGKTDILLLDGHRQIGLFVDALAAKGRVVGRDVGILSDSEMCPGTIYLKTDYAAMSVEILRLISALAAAPDRPLGRVVLPGFITRTPLKIDVEAPAVCLEKGIRHARKA